MSNVVASRAIWISASLLPLPLLMAAATTGGIFILLAIVYMTFAIILIDEFSYIWRAGVTQDRSELSREFFPLVLGIAHFAILGVAVHALGKSSGSTLEWILHLYAFGLFFGVISFANAYQLAQQGSHLHSKLGEWIFASLLFGYYTPYADRKIQNTASSKANPHAAKQGESFYRYFLRMVPKTFSETMKTFGSQREAGTTSLVHPLATRFLIGILFLTLTTWMAGVKAMVGLFLVALIAQTASFLSKYVQHYGLGTEAAAQSAVRKWESPKVLWDLTSNQDASNSLAPTHHSFGAPVLPFSLMSMCFIALAPSAWRNLMDQRVTVWKDTAKFLQS